MPHRPGRQPTPRFSGPKIYERRRYSAHRNSTIPDPITLKQVIRRAGQSNWTKLEGNAIGNAKGVPVRLSASHYWVRTFALKRSNLPCRKSLTDYYADVAFAVRKREPTARLERARSSSSILRIYSAKSDLRHATNQVGLRGNHHGGTIRA